MTLLPTLKDTKYTLEGRGNPVGREMEGSRRLPKNGATFMKEHGGKDLSPLFLVAILEDSK